MPLNNQSSKNEQINRNNETYVEKIKHNCIDNPDDCASNGTAAGEL